MNIHHHHDDMHEADWHRVERYYPLVMTLIYGSSAVIAVYSIVALVRGLVGVTDLRADLLRIAADEPQTLAQILAAVDSPAIRVVNMVQQMREQGDLIALPAPTGSGSGTRNAYLAVVSR